MANVVHAKPLNIVAAAARYKGSFRVKYPTTNANKNPAVPILVNRCGLSLERIDGISKIAKKNPPTANNMSCQIIV
jgi:hypothetical protein